MGLLNVIDFETTGLNKGRVDYAVSMGALVADFKDDKTIECTGSLYSLIKIPNPSMAADTKFIHGISVEEVANAPEPSKVCTEFLKLKRKHGFEHAAAWYYPFDKVFFERLFEQANKKAPTLNWSELQTIPFKKLDNCAPGVRCGFVKGLSGHHALKDCARALCVYAEHNGYNLDVSSLKNELEAWKS